jgi:hypothetical protein
MFWEEMANIREVNTLLSVVLHMFRFCPILSSVHSSVILHPFPFYRYHSSLFPDRFNCDRNDDVSSSFFLFLEYFVFFLSHDDNLFF